MTIPKYNELFNNVLSIFSDEMEEYKTRDVKKIVSDLLNLPPEERNFLKNNTNEPLVEYNLGWTLTYLKKAGLLESKKRGYINITELGLKEINENPNITEKDLYKFPSFVEFKRGNDKSDIKPNQSNLDNHFKSLNSKKEVINIFNQINSEISSSLLELISQNNIEIFQNLILDLVFKFNYHEFNLENTDEDMFNGILNQDGFGFDKVGIQGINIPVEVHTSDLQLFAGFLVSKGLTKGIFITTSSFNKSVIDYVRNQSNLNIVLIDGKKLAELLIKYNVGTKIVDTFELKAIDENYFNV